MGGEHATVAVDVTGAAVPHLQVTALATELRHDLTQVRHPSGDAWVSVG